MNRKITYEWVVVSSRGDDLYLTENQYEFYKRTRSEGIVEFADFSINPSFVVKTQKREAEKLFEKYPCKNCGTKGWFVPKGVSGSDGITEECSVCKGTGIYYHVS